MKDFFGKALRVTVAVSLCISTLNAFNIISDNTPLNRQDASNKNAIYSYNSSIKDAIPAIVNITTEKKVGVREDSPFNDPFFKQFFGDIRPQDRLQGGIGSGVIVQSDGYIVTNSHVVGGADKINVTLPGDKMKYRAKLIGNDPQTDIAVIKIEKNNLPTLKFADSSKYTVGDIVFAIGNPFGVGESVTQGIISALNKYGFGISNYENFIQTDASINPGNSGGALIDTRGYFVGMNTAIISRTGGNHGIGFAIPSNMVKHIAQELVRNGKVIRGYLGVSIKDIDSNEVSGVYGASNGALVVGIEANSAAQKGGLQLWDLITSVNGKEVKNSSELKNVVGQMKPGERVKVSVIRKSNSNGNNQNETKDIYIVLAAQKNNDSVVAKSESTLNQGIFDGLVLNNISNQIRNVYRIPEDITGVFVSEVKDNSKAQFVGFEKGDVISQVENYKIKNIDDFNKAIKSGGRGAKRMLIYNMLSGEVKTIVAN